MFSCPQTIMSSRCSRASPPRNPEVRPSASSCRRPTCYNTDSTPAESDGPHPLERRAFKFIIAAAVASIACTVLNITILGFHPSWSPAPTPSGRLPYANSYVGLETAVRDPNSPPIKPIMNYPVVLAQIDKSTPKKVFLDTHHLPSPFGTFFPEDRKFKVSKDVRSVHFSVNCKQDSSPTTCRYPPLPNSVSSISGWNDAISSPTCPPPPFSTN